MSVPTHLEPTTEVLLELLGALYEGPLEAEPWRSFGERLRVLFEARNVAITLHHPQGLVRDSYVMVQDPEDRTDWVEVETTYRRDFMEDDPLRLELFSPGTVVQLDVVERSAEFAHFVADLNIGSCLRVGFSEPGGMRGWIDIVRARSDSVPFAAGHTELLHTLEPHLCRALTLFAVQKMREAECSVYEDTIEHFALGTLLLDGELRVMRVNGVARAVLEAQRGLAIVRGRLRSADPGVQRRLDRALRDAVMSATGNGGAGREESLQIASAAGHAIGVLVRPLAQALWFRGSHAPSVIVYLTDSAQQPGALSGERRSSRELVERLFGLTPQEARLALRLADGDTLADAARHIGVAETAARSYSKRIYAKLDIGSRSELVRLLHRSLALLG